MNAATKEALQAARKALLRIRTLSDREAAKRQGVPKAVRREITGVFAYDAARLSLAEGLIADPPSLYARDLAGVYKERLSDLNRTLAGMGDPKEART